MAHLGFNCMKPNSYFYSKNKLEKDKNSFRVFFETTKEFKTNIDSKKNKSS